MSRVFGIEGKMDLFLCVVLEGRSPSPQTPQMSSETADYLDFVAEIMEENLKDLRQELEAQ